VRFVDCQEHRLPVAPGAPAVAENRQRHHGPLCGRRQAAGVDHNEPTATNSSSSDRFLAGLSPQSPPGEAEVGDSSSERSGPFVRGCRRGDVGSLIAGEGRKFGIHLFVASQRPGKVHPNVLSQCDNLILMRMNGAQDIDELESAFSHVPPRLLHEALSFGLGQALFAGPLAPLPLIAQVGTRLTPEGGADVPTTWTAPPSVE